MPLWQKKVYFLNFFGFVIIEMVYLYIILSRPRQIQELIYTLVIDLLIHFVSNPYPSQGFTAPPS